MYALYFLLTLHYAQPLEVYHYKPGLNLSNPTGFNYTPDYADAYVYDGNIHPAPETLSNLSIRDISCTAIDVTVNLDERNHFSLTMETLYLTVISNNKIR